MNATAHKHANACGRICISCGVKIKMKKLNGQLIPDENGSVRVDERISRLASVYCEVDWDVDRGDQSIQPRRICTNCRLLLCQEGRTKNYFGAINVTREHTETGEGDCDICRKAFKVGRPKLTISMKSKKMTLVKICPICHADVMRGKSHNCRLKMTTANVLKYARKTVQNPLKLASAIIHKTPEDSAIIKLPSPNRQKMEVTIGKTKIPVLSVSAQDALRENAVLKMSRRIFLKRSQIWRERLEEQGIRAKIVGVKAVNDLCKQRVNDLYSVSTIRGNVGTEANPNIRDIDVTHCTNICALARRVASHRGKILQYIKIQGDHGRKVLKISAQFCESNSVDDLSILAATKFSGESCVTIAGILDLIKPNELIKNLGCKIMLAGDLKFLQLYLGIKTGNATYPCPWCVWRMTGPERMTVETVCPERDVKKDIAAFRKLDCDREKSSLCHGQQFAVSEEHLVQPNEIAPPMLHIMLGLCNQISSHAEEEFGLDIVTREWYNSAKVVKSVYQGGTFEGNDCRKLISSATQWKPTSPLYKYQTLMVTFNNMINKVFAIRYDLTDEEIYQMSEVIHEFIALWQHHTRSALQLTCPLKLHILAVHVLEFAIRERCTPASFGEQDGESLHRKFYMVWDSVKAQGANAIPYTVKTITARNF